MDRTCPPEIFREAHNGLNLFLTEYPHMTEEQIEEICKLVDYFARPQYYHKKIRRPELLCRSRPDGVLLIAPRFVNSP